MKSNLSTALIVAAIATLPVEEAKATLDSLSLPTKGPKKPNTLLAEAIESGKARLSIAVTVKAPYADPANPDTYMPTLHKSRVYTYKARKTDFGS